MPFIESVGRIRPQFCSARSPRPHLGALGSQIVEKLIQSTIKLIGVRLGMDNFNRITYSLQWLGSVQCFNVVPLVWFTKRFPLFCQISFPPFAGAFSLHIINPESIVFSCRLICLTKLFQNSSFPLICLLLIIIISRMSRFYGYSVVTSGWRQRLLTHLDSKDEQELTTFGLTNILYTYIYIGEADAMSQWWAPFRSIDDGTHTKIFQFSYFELTSMD